MERKIVKAEILWTRACPMNCSHCNMATGKVNTVSLALWKQGLDQLKKLGCSFAAIYGAEPLYSGFGINIRLDGLPDFIQYAERIGIHTTVITSGVVTLLREKLELLYNYGLRSITASYDINPYDKYSQLKTNKALYVIDTFRSFGPVRDVAIVVTLTKQNYKNLPKTIIEMSERGIWTFFDLVHPDRGQEGSKVKNSDMEVFFRKEDFPSLIETLEEVADLKSAGLLCHTSFQYIEILKLVSAHLSNINEYNITTPYMWNCAMTHPFPSWVTVNCDGKVYPCDDFQSHKVPSVNVWDIYDRWEAFSKMWKKYTSKYCPGCLWNTHIDAHLIKQGDLPITDYIHGLNGKTE